MNFRSIIKMIIGVGVAALGAVLSFVFFDAFKILMLGVIGPLLILVGLVVVAIAKE